MSFSFSIVVKEGEPNEKRFRVREQLANDIIDLLENEKRFWEWKEELELSRRICKAQSAMIDTLQKRLTKQHSEEYIKNLGDEFNRIFREHEERIHNLLVGPAPERFDGFQNITKEKP